MSKGGSRHNGDDIGVAVEAKYHNRDGEQGLEVPMEQRHMVISDVLRPRTHDCCAAYDNGKGCENEANHRSHRHPRKCPQIARKAHGQDDKQSHACYDHTAFRELAVCPHAGQMVSRRC